MVNTVVPVQNATGFTGRASSRKEQRKAAKASAKKQTQPASEESLEGLKLDELDFDLNELPEKFRTAFLAERRARLAAEEKAKEQEEKAKEHEEEAKTQKKAAQTHKKAAEALEIKYKALLAERLANYAQHAQLCQRILTDDYFRTCGFNGSEDLGSFIDRESPLNPEKDLKRLLKKRNLLHTSAHECTAKQVAHLYAAGAAIIEGDTMAAAQIGTAVKDLGDLLHFVTKHTAKEFLGPGGATIDRNLVNATNRSNYRRPVQHPGTCNPINAVDFGAQQLVSAN